MKAIFILSVGSHQNSTFALAKQMARMGWEVGYAGTIFGVYGESLYENATRQGFKYEVLDPYKKVDFESMGLQIQEPNEDLISIAYNLFEGKIFREFISKTRPDIIFLDVHLPLYGLALYPFKTEIVFLSTELYTGRSTTSPPLTSSRIPDIDVFSPAQINAEWDKYLAEHAMNGYIKILIEELSTQHNIPMAKLFVEKCVVLFGLKYPEIVLWPAEFEFVLPTTANVHYLGCYVDMHRNERLLNIGSHKELIYFAIGTVLNSQQLSKFVTTAIEAFTKLPEYYFIVSIGKLSRILKLGRIPFNVEVHEYVPQLKVLQNADLMITMGGANSIKECIIMGIPMLCYPFHNDQFGNSARVEFHKLGMRGDINDSPSEMVERIRNIATNPQYKKNVTLFRESTKNMISDVELLNLLETFI